MCPAEEPMEAPAHASAPTVLVVEDEVLIRLGICEHLRESGLNVVEAASAVEARDIIMAGVTVDLVFSDINMPGALDGAGLALWLRDMDISLPVVLTSGMAQVLADAQARCAHVKAFVAKPYSYEAVEAKLRRLIDARAKQG